MELTKERINEIRTHAMNLLHNYADEIPSMVVSGEMRYKVQKNWFNAVNLLFFRPARKGQLDAGMVAKLSEFAPVIKRLQSEDATAADIKKGNEMLEALVEYCNRKEKELVAAELDALAKKQADLLAEQHAVHAAEKDLRKTGKKIDKAEQRAGI